MSSSFSHNDILQLENVHTFAIDKAKYLVDMSFLVGIFKGETYGNAFIARVTKKDMGLAMWKIKCVM